MRYKREVLKSQLEVVDTVCDCCGAKDSEYRKAHLGDPLPMIKLEGAWGEASKKDMEYHTSWICEECYDKIIEHFNIKPLVKVYSIRSLIGTGKRDFSDDMHVNLNNEKRNGAIIDENDGIPRFEKEDWQQQEKIISEAADKFRDWANQFIEDLDSDESYSGPPPEGREVREYKREIAAKLRELF